MYWHEVKYQPERTKTYLGSPSLVRLPNGALLATHDYFGLRGVSPAIMRGEESLTSVYRSEDDGQSWGERHPHHELLLEQSVCTQR